MYPVLSLGCPLIQQKDEVVVVVMYIADATVADGPLSAAFYCIYKQVLKGRRINMDGIN